MTGTDAILYALQSTAQLLDGYLNDFSDADLLVRPVENANHIAWQLGHMVEAEIRLVKHEVHAVEYPALPAGFAKAHTAETASNADGFFTAEEYRTLFAKVRKSTMAAVRGLPPDELDRPSVGPLAALAPTLGELFLLVANHTLMHGGQITVVRRKLGKPVLF